MPLSEARNRERMKQARVQPSFVQGIGLSIPKGETSVTTDSGWIDSVTLEAVQPNTRPVQPKEEQGKPTSVKPVPPYPTPLTSEQFRIAPYPKILAKGEMCTLSDCIICGKWDNE